MESITSWAELVMDILTLLTPRLTFYQQHFIQLLYTVPTLQPFIDTTDSIIEMTGGHRNPLNPQFKFSKSSRIFFFPQPHLLKCCCGCVEGLCVGEWRAPLTMLPAATEPGARTLTQRQETGLVMMIRNNIHSLVSHIRYHCNISHTHKMVAGEWGDERVRVRRAVVRGWCWPLLHWSQPLVTSRQPREY